MKILNGADLAEYVKVRQAAQVRALRQSKKVEPTLAIIVAKEDPVITTYVNLKKSYGSDILINVDIHRIEQSKAIETIKILNASEAVHGIIVQLPLQDTTQTDKITNAVAPEKDVDGLGAKALFDPATPTAINWLIAGYNIDIRSKKIAIIGNGKLVGKPLYDMWRKAEYDVTMVSRSDNLNASLVGKELIVSATGTPGLVKAADLPIDTIVIDAGVASESGKTVGDVEEAAYQRADLTITPRIGGVGPLTVAALFDNVIRAATKS